ncbi:hypothetical protein FBU59_004251, partial [Linderina macrospora]
MAQQMKPTAPYVANYSYQGMNNINVLNENVPNVLSEASGLINNTQQQGTEAQGQVSAASSATINVPSNQPPPAPPPPPLAGQQQHYPPY